ncbi:HEAT repeat family protein [Histomonas meleagridis]|uniref:HEAT repeat family protein n=1 Tax=Histomonas meleagridis TaxID=135588 RepID=UPI00355A48E5|nr:HEAT repeat family protein [Histomonas meleagridis]KAH0796729.1 HEAT repeat family protein [Histomonas meleagridis]
MYYSADYSTSVVSAIPKFLVTYLSKTKDIKTTISIFQSLIISSDWRVRCITIKIFPDLFHIYKIPVSFFVSLYEHCIQDSEIEVKIAIVQQLKILINVPEAKEQLQNLLLNALSNDSPHIVTIAIQYALEMRNPTFITQNVIKLLRSQNVEIKLAAINALKTPSIPKEIIIQQMLHIINYSNDWRERESLVYLLTDLTFDVNEIIIKLLSDEAYKVRKSMVAQIPKLISKFGNEWAINHLMPFIKQTVKYEDYQIREVGAMALLCAELHHTKEGEKILDAFAKDPVGNVKIVIARNIEKGHPILQLLMKDDDEDVRLEASK